MRTLRVIPPLPARKATQRAARERRPRTRDADRSRAALLGARALSLGVFGVPTVVVGDQLFWGDDHLEEAASVAEQQLE